MRRALVVVIVASLAVLLTRMGTVAQPKSPAEAAKPFKAVVHVNFSDAERQKHGLKNVGNMLKAVKTDFEIVVVCHGDGIGLLVKDQSKHAAEVERLGKEGVRFAACENTMRDRSITKDQLLAVVTVPSGAVEVVRKQQDGYGYFKP